ncbi:cytochrome P450 [Neobacillus sp. LXY-4]|uniref:cytochrome P450 n=1 Tax=Neobacillus sp. LXY-4 TaxID=3379826 RepID=UPI003EE197D2
MTNTQALKIKPFSLSSSAFLEDPYPIYDQMRSTNPILKMSAFKYPGVYVTGYEESVAILKNPKFQNRTPLPQASKKYEALKNVQDNMLLFKNQQDHKQLRMLMSKGFTTSAMEEYRPYIEKTVDDLIDQVKNNKKMDIVTDLAFQLASQIIAKILGVPEEDRYQFREWTLTLIPTIDFTRSRTVLANGNDTTKRLMEYFKQLIKQRKQHLQHDFISILIEEGQQGDTLTDEELLAACILLVIAGHETTVNLISNSMLSLLNNREQLTLLRENPTLIESAVEEFLRFESPTQLTARVATETIELNGTIIQQGEQVYILLGAANRDPRQFKNPNQLDITRNPNPHLAFGAGSHFCIGSTLARMEAQIAIQTLLGRFNLLQLATSQLQWRELAGFRALKELPISFS